VYACIIGAAAWAFGRHRSDAGLPALALPIQASGKTFYSLCLWVMLCINISCGIALVSVAAPLMQEMGGASAQSAAALVGVAGLFNAVGRIFWANLSDVMGRPSIWISLFFLGLLSFAAMSVVADAFLFQAFFMLAMACFGGGFACMPPYVADLFGPDQVPRVYGTMMTALSAAGFIGPGIISQVWRSTGSYLPSLPIFVCLLAVGCILSMLLGRRVRAFHLNVRSTAQIPYASSP
jgi:OFA family oxalate/formate antiporter-like MFS transporter